MTTFDGLVAGGRPSVGLVRASKRRLTGRLGNLVIVPVALVGVDRPWRKSAAGISRNSNRSKAPGYSAVG